MRELNEIMEFDHVIEVQADGTIVDRPDLYAPEAYADGGTDPDMTGTDWALLRGYTGQYSYTGPVMHPSEYIGGRMEDDIRSTPGVYVAVVVTDLSIDTESADDNAVGWAVARKEGNK
jgi:hypothetical protein